MQKIIEAIKGLFLYLEAQAKQDLPQGHLPVPPPPPDVVVRPLGLLVPLARAIQTFEGFYPGSTSYRNNNPGNMRYSTYCQSLGATGMTLSHFAIFPNLTVGFNALCQFIKDAANDKLIMGKNLTLQQFMDKYAPVTDGNDPHKYANFIAKSIGVASVDILLKNLI